MRSKKCKRKSEINRILLKKSEKSILNERRILIGLSDSFIVNIKGAFQDKNNLYLILNFLSGGDFRFHICYNTRFTEEQTKFFAGCILMGLKYIHSKNIIHRDIKPENLVFDQNGYLRITDFGIARFAKEENREDTSGTPGYMAPEVMVGQQHGFEVDYFALGVICYECALGKRPYIGENRKEIRNKMLTKQILIDENDPDFKWSKQSRDFINGLIQRRSQKRLGTNGLAEILNHDWFKDFSWEQLSKKTMKSTYSPDSEVVFEYLKRAEIEENANEIKENKIYENYSFSNASNG